MARQYSHEQRKRGAVNGGMECCTGVSESGWHTDSVITGLASFCAAVATCVESSVCRIGRAASKFYQILMSSMVDCIIITVALF